MSGVLVDAFRGILGSKNILLVVTILTQVKTIPFLSLISFNYKYTSTLSYNMNEQKLSLHPL